MKRVELYARVRHAVMIEGLSQREAARRFGIDPRTVKKMLRYSVPPGYVRRRPPVRPKLDPFIGVIDRILDEDAFGKAYDHRVVTRFLPYILPHKLLVTVATLSMLALTGSLVAGPWIIKLGIDGFIETRDLAGLSLVVGLFLLNAAVTFAAGYAQEVTIGMLGQRVLFRLRGDMFRHLQKMSLRFYDKTEVGRIMSRVQGDVYQLQEFAAVAVSTLGEILSLVGIVAALLLLSPKLGLISMTVLPVLVVAMIVWQPFAIKAFLRVRRAMSIVNGALNENITGVRVVQAMNRQDRNLELFDEKNRENYKSGLVASRLTAAVMPPVSFLSSLSIAMAIGGALDYANELYSRRPESRSRPIKGYVQVVKIAIYFGAAILMIAVLIEQSPLLLLSGLGAMAAVLLLVFKDTILSLVASVQLTSNDMLRVGGWIEMPSMDADGDVIDIALHTVKVQNFDKTITTIPTYKLINESYRNWRGMAESGGRRIKRAIHLDQNTLRFLTEQELADLRRFRLLRDYLDRKEQELRDDGVRHLVGDGRAQEYDPLLEQERVYVVGSLTPGAALDHHRNQALGSNRHLRCPLCYS